MKKQTRRVVFLCALFIATSATAVPLQHRVPPYHEWIKCIDIPFDSNVAVKTCTDNYESLSSIRDVRDTIFEYRKTGASEPSLLVWVREPLPTNNPNQMTYVRFYTWDKAWVFVDGIH